MEAFGNAGEQLDKLVAIIVKLRAPDGCPWDRIQKKEDIGGYLIEEAYEVLEAIARRDTANLCEELGDLLFQVLFIAAIAEENGEFNLADVIGEITAKMVRRHPHVFGNTTAATVDDVKRNWETIKTEIEHKGLTKGSIGAGISPALPTLSQAQVITSRAAKLGFDWSDTQRVLEKLEEESAELRAAISTGEKRKITEETGDLLLTIVNLCRFTDVDAEASLRLGLRKFTDRFAYIEERLAAIGKTPGDSSLAEMDKFWEEAKRQEGF